MGGGAGVGVEREQEKEKNRFKGSSDAVNIMQCLGGGGGASGWNIVLNWLEGVCGPKPLASAKMVVDVRFEGL